MNYQETLRQMQRAIRNGEAALGEQLFAPCQGRSGADQLAVYIRNHRYALLQALRSHYPLSRDQLGSPEFDRLARNHVLGVPSTHPNIERYAMGFGRAAAQQESDAAACLTFEAAVLESLLAESAPCLVPTAGLSHVRPHPALRLLDLTEDVLARREGAEPGHPSPLAISRPGYQLRFSRLEPDEYRLLSELVAGKPMAEALEGQPPASLAAAPTWFARWIAEGFFAA